VEQRRRTQQHFLNRISALVTRSILTGFLYCIGGAAEENLDSVERFDPMLDQWTEIASLNEPRRNMAAVAMNGFIYALGKIKTYQLIL